ncbi:MAG: winged helix-turn-helix transcriptional regulator [Propionibacteriaceae bacterium]|nr:winged helix-turn-helix transcriptional regulator [Propionibacteriaceae bacterium]
MATRFLTDQFWLDELSLAPYLQCPPDEARDAIAQLAAISRGGSPVVEPIPGTPPGSLTAFTLTQPARAELEAAYQQRGQQPPIPRRALVARVYAEHRGRISTTELASIVGASPSNVGSQLKELEAEGVLVPSSPSRAGRGFHYRWDGEVTQS